MEAVKPIETDKVSDIPELGDPHVSPMDNGLAAAPLPATPPVAPQRRKPHWLWRVIRTLLLLCLIIVILAIVFEMRTSWLQSHLLPTLAQSMRWQVKTGPSDAIRYADAGPYDQRLGYHGLGERLQRLTDRGYSIRQQSRFSAPMLTWRDHGLYIPYAEKSQAGLTLYDCHHEPFHVSRYPLNQFSSFATIPPLVLNALLYIENRHLLEDDWPFTNPAVDWPRFANAAVSQVSRHVGVSDSSSGGSTLATQMEKFRHSPYGRTSSSSEKLRQMASASLRAYQQGPLTLNARQQLALDYLNSVPLAAAPGYGEVHGLGDGLFVWFGANVESSWQQLQDEARTPEALAAQGLTLRQVVSLLIAHRRPSWYLLGGRNELDELTNSYLRLLGSEGLLTAQQTEAALAVRLQYRNFIEEPAYTRIDSNKARYVTRGRLGQMLGLSLYDLDHQDLSVQSQLDNRLQQQVSTYLRQLADPTVAGQVGLFGERLLSPEKTADVRYSFTLFERQPDGFQVRVQTDNTDQPFDINDSSKLELGSTAKLRVLTTYLQIISELHQRLQGMDGKALRQLPVDPQDHLSQWVRDTLLQQPQITLEETLEAALDRHYSANPGESFFTGGGMHVFANFRREDNGRNPTLREALQESINLPFIRLMRDIVRYTQYQDPTRRTLLTDDADPRREEYLKRFADREGITYLQRFWNKYAGKDSVTRMDTLIDGLRPTQSRLAAIHRYLFAAATPAELASFIRKYLPQEPLTDKRLDYLYNTYGPGKFSLPDQGYVARIHPLELWLLNYLNLHSQAKFSDTVAASKAERLEVYGWLFKSRHRSARDSRMRTMLEIEAFSDIHQRWKALGYPFDHLVPSLATAIGSSGDRPAALAELMGIILNDGVRLPVQRFAWMQFAAGTPYETLVTPAPVQGQQVIPVPVARALRHALSQVVEQGTARRLAGTFMLPDGTPLIMGGKTGTGDNRIEKVARGGQVITSRAMNRTATFVFYLGDHYFGTLTAFVEGSSADKFRFTSALPVQVLKGMAPLLSPYLLTPVPREPTTAPPTPGVETAKWLQTASCQPGAGV